MVGPDSKIEPTRDRDSVRSAESANKRKEIPNRDFREVVEQIDERRRFRDEEEKNMKSAKKRSPGKESSVLGRELPSDRPPSLFELARGYKGNSSPKKEKNDAEGEVASMSVKRRNAAKETEAQPLSFDLEEGRKKKTDSRFGALEQPDLAAVNPAAALVQTANAIHAGKTLEAAKNVHSMQEIIDQIVKGVYTLEEKGRSETVIELKGAFAGSRLIINQFDSAHREMNITIDNLKGPAKELIDSHKNELISKLADEKIVVHMFTATTTLENPRIDLSQATGRDGQQDPREHYRGQSDAEDDENG